MTKQSVIITNANIFNGTSDKLAAGMSVLIEGNKISKIARSIPASSGATVIDAKGCAMTPGLIDAHAHLQWNLSPAEMFTASLDYLASLVLVEAKATLMRGFFESVSVTIDEPLDGDRLQAVFDTLPEALLRAKGVLNLAQASVAVIAKTGTTERERR